MPPYLQGLGIGLAYVAPIGMQNLFVINSALTQPRRKALLTALIVVFFDISLALACFFGIGALMDRFTWLQMVILLVGGAIVIWIGIGLLRDHPHHGHQRGCEHPPARDRRQGLRGHLVHPQALIDGTMLFGSFHANNPGAGEHQLILGSSSASFLWFFGITVLISLFSAKFNDKILRGHQHHLRHHHHFLRRQADLELLPDDPVTAERPPMRERPEQPLRGVLLPRQLSWAVTRLTSTWVIFSRASAGMYSCTPWKLSPPVDRLAAGQAM